MKLKKLLSLLLIAMVLVALTACGGDEETDTKDDETQKKTEEATEAPDDKEEVTEDETPEEVTIRFSWWGGDSRHEATIEAVDKFMVEYPHIKVETEYGAWSGWEEKMALAFSEMNAPDVNQVNWNWISDFSPDGNTFYDLNQLSDVFDISQFDSGALELCTVDGKLQAVPVSMTGRLFFWNAKTFERAGISTPTTWEELLAAGEIFANELGDEYYPLTLGEYDRAIFMVHYLESVYNKPWVVDNELQYTQEEIEDGFAMMKELEDKHVMPTIKELNERGVEALEQSDRWIDGYYAGAHTWDTAAQKLRNAIEDSTNVEGQELVPGDPLKAGDYDGGFTKISQCFSIAANTEHPEESALLLEYLLNEEEGVVTLGDTRGIPASAAGLAIADANDIISEFNLKAYDVMINSNPFPLDPKFENAGLKSDPDGTYYVVFENHSYGNYDNAKAAEELIKGINDVLAK